ncbi:MAG: hypothetical protein JWO56_1917 [Acidobacteria bacterium]|nr:hypothetical protein [Acidobacteriota bacterium]
MRRSRVGKEKVRDADPVHNEDASPFDAHARRPERLAHLGERAGTIVDSRGEEIDANAFKALIRAAVVLNTSGGKKSPKRK